MAAYFNKWIRLFLAFIFLAGMAGSAQAGLLDDLKKAGEETQKGFEQLGEDIKDASQKVKKSIEGSDKQPQLPSGVRSRLKKIDKEVSKAEKLLTQGPDDVKTKAQRAQRHLKKAERFKKEIEKQYAGQFSPQDPAVELTFARLQAVSDIVAQSLGEASPDKAPSRVKGPQKALDKLPAGVSKRLRDINRDLDKVQRAIAKNDAGNGRYYLKAARAHWDEIRKRYPDDAVDNFEAIKQADQRMADLESQVAALEQESAAKSASKESAQQTAQADCQAWVEKLTPYTEGDQALYNYMTSDPDVLKKGKARYDQAARDRARLADLNLPEGACPHLAGTVRLLDRYMANFEALYTQHQQKAAAAQAIKGAVLFAKHPIDPANPQNLTDAFNAGDAIYALIQSQKSFEEIFKTGWIRIDVTIDGKPIHAQFIKLHQPDDRARKTLAFEIAPAPDKMTAYSNPDIEYGVSKANLKQGPQEMCLHLSKLAPGQHIVSLVVKHYGKIYAQGQFTLEGDDYQFYADLHQKAQAAMAKSVHLPRARMENPELEGSMRDLLQKAGWSDIHRLNIVDKNWWLDRISGGDSPIKSRRIDAAVLAKDDQGYYYKKVRFQQDRLITGDWSKLYIVHTFDRVHVPEENIDR